MSTWHKVNGAMMIVLAVVLAAPLAVAAEDVDAEFEAGNWGTQATIGLNMLQSYYTENWNGGDKGSVVWNATLDAVAQKQLSPTWHWFNTLNLAFGQNHQQARDDNGELFWPKPDKTTDQFKAESLLRYTKSDWAPFAGVRFESQFLDQSDPRGDFTLNPLEFFETVGISRLLVDTEERKFLARFGFTFHQMIRDIYLDPAFSQDPVNEKSGDGGLELTLNYTDKVIAERIEYTGQLRFYQPVYYSGKSDVEDLGSDYLEGVGLPTDLADYTTTLDIDFDNTFKANITSVINVQLQVRWIYDKYDNSVKPVVVDDEIHNVASVDGSIRKKGQLKQTMSIGLGYTF
jgi:hypothetical protein